MSAANRKAYLGEPVHYALKDNDCRAAVVSRVEDHEGLALTWYPVGALPVPARNVKHNETRLSGTWHFAH